MQRVLDFLRDLHDHNDREWFIAHKEQYLAARNIFNEFAMNLVKGIREFDDSIGNLSLSDVTYRIYRDVRFSKNKAPYKCHMGAYVCPGGKKSGCCGYYFQISAADDGGWEGNHMIAVGNYFMEPKVLKVLREDILFGKGDFRAISGSADPRLELDRESALKKVPAGFPADSEDSELFKLKNYSMSYTPDDEFVLSDDLLPRLLEIYKSALPFTRYINRAVALVKEEQDGPAAVENIFW